MNLSKVEFIKILDKIKTCIKKNLLWRIIYE